MRKFNVLPIALLLSACAVPAPAPEAQPAAAGPLPGAVYAASGVGLAGVEQALTRAQARGTRLLVVLGADWCHDSRALAERLQTEPLASLVAERYEMRVVDVGYLERGRDVAQRFGVEQIYATPTVLVVDPGSGALVNANDRHQWGAAAKIDMSDAVDYFERMAMAAAPGDPAAGLAREFVDAVERYERDAAGHVALGYARVGPLLRAYKAGEKPEGFDAQWDEVAAFRKSVPGQVQSLWDEARAIQAAGGPAAALRAPAIAPWSWQGTD